MATRVIHDLYDECTLHITGGSQEFFFLSLFKIDSDGLNRVPLDLSRVEEIEWRLAPFSVIPEKGVAMLRKRMTTDDIIILRDGSDGTPNQIQVTIYGTDTRYLRGAFLHQISIVDGAGVEFVPFEGVLNINRRIQI